MTGVLCELSNECITFVATDAHKLVRYRNAKVKTEDFASFILSKKPIAHLKNILSGVEGSVHVEYSQETHHVRFFDNYTLYSSLKDGKYPNYDAVIPKSNPNSFVVSAKISSGQSVVWLTIQTSPLSKFAFLCLQIRLALWLRIWTSLTRHLRM